MWVWVICVIRGINLRRHKESVFMNGSGPSLKKNQWTSYNGNVVVRTVKVKNQGFLGVTTCLLVNIFSYFRRSMLHPFSGLRNQICELLYAQIETSRPFGTSLKTRQTSPRNIPQNVSIQSHCKTVKYRKNQHTL